MVDINIMPGSFRCYHVSSFVRIYSVLGYEINIGLIQDHHLGWQEEHRIIIDLTMSIESPAEAMLSDQHANTKRKYFFQNSWGWGRSYSFSNFNSGFGSGFFCVSLSSSRSTTPPVTAYFMASPAVICSIFLT